jgi:hypothetical protein
MYDPDAYVGRRAWLRCPRCPHDNCGSCRRGAACTQHWLYLLASDSRLVFVQCPNCLQRWWHDTGHGVGHRPDFPQPALPGIPDEAA